MPTLLKAKPIIDAKLPALKQKCQELTAKGLTPKLSVIMVGNNPASQAYVRNKQRLCEKIGALFHLEHLSTHIAETDFLKQLDEINNDSSVTGCFVQLPIPRHLSHLDVTQLIKPEKDVDGFHLQTVNNLYMGNTSSIIPCTPKGIVTLLKENNIKLAGKDIVIIGRSHIVGKPLSLLLQCYDATVTLCHSRTKDLSKHTKQADIIISAVGNPKLLDENYIRHDQTQILIDVGMNKTDQGLVGDFDFENLQDKVKAITPVPGGVGPMTVFSLMENLLYTTENLING